MNLLIIDNSTLTAVQRLTGAVPVSSSYSVQGDYAALENFFAGLMFHEAFYYIDDYKPEFKAERETQFPYIRRVPPSMFPYADLENRASELTRNLALEVRAGRQAAGLLKQFLDDVGLYVTCAWHLQTSDYFLTLKLLADEPDTWENRCKYSPLTSMIFDQLHGAIGESPLPVLENREHQTIPAHEQRGGREYHVGTDVLAFSNALHWLARRAAFYAFASGHFSASVCLHPIRHNFLSRWAAKEQVITASPTWRRRLTEFFGTQASSAVNAINAAAESYEIGAELPLFAAWAVGSAGNVTDAVSFVLDHRTNPEAVGIRSKLAGLDELRLERTAKHKAEINKLRSAVEAEAGARQKVWCDASPTGAVDFGERRNRANTNRRGRSGYSIA
jgi:hypothetical protein